jgi:branched-subunit amino acid ABC-type transport system permease component
VRRWYGAAGVHLLAHGAAFAIAAYALAQIFHGGRVVNFIAWFGGAAILHDLGLLPAYSLLDRLARRHVHRVRPASVAPVINHVRVPALISGLLLLVYFPLILGLATPTYLGASGHRPEGYARNWALITAALFGASAIVYVLRTARRRRR